MSHDFVMNPRLRVTRTAKIRARMALKERSRLPKSKRFGLDKQQARELGIVSGVERAKQLSRSKSVSFEDAKSISRFYLRFKNKRGVRARGSVDLWGGKKFGRQATVFVRSYLRNGKMVREHYRGK